MTAFGTPTYGITRELPGVAHGTAVERVRYALAGQGFGVLTTIDMTETLHTKLGVELGRPYTILGACNPAMAHAAVGEEPGIGLLLPCNVVVTENPGGTVVVSAVDPDEMFQVVKNPDLEPIASEVKGRLEAALEAVAAA